jgi:hypothetical protein
MQGWKSGSLGAHAASLELQDWVAARYMHDVKLRSFAITTTTSRTQSPMINKTNRVLCGDGDDCIGF